MGNTLDNNLISRQTVLDMLEDINAETDGVGFYYEHYVEYIKNLPSVTPKEKIGHWIETNSEIDVKYGRHSYKCSECGDYANDFVYGMEDWWDACKPNYCPNCGVRMVEPQESEEV